MPSDSMNIQEQGFRSRMFGGFDKNDVLAYMNTLANEAQQHELEYQEKLRQLQAQLDDLRSQRSDAEARVEALKAELAAANQRADLAESKRHESDEQLQKAQSVAESVQSEHREIQKNANIWQLKCHDLQQQNETLTQQLAAARQLNAAPAPTPDVVREAKLELKQQADTQKSRMAENARGIASGVMLVRDRLARVDQRLSAATLDLDNLTLAIYQALDETEAELKELGVEMRDYAQGTPETDIPMEPLPTESAPAAPVVPQPVPQTPQPVQQPQPQAAPPKPEKFRVKATPHRAPAKPVRRLRSVNRPVSQLLQDQIDRMGDNQYFVHKLPDEDRGVFLLPHAPLL